MLAIFMAFLYQLYETQILCLGAQNASESELYLPFNIIPSNTQESRLQTEDMTGEFVSLFSQCLDPH